MASERRRSPRRLEDRPPRRGRPFDRRERAEGDAPMTPAAVPPRVGGPGPGRRRRGSPSRRPVGRLVPLLATLLLPASGLLAEPVVVPGGTASIRRLLDLGDRRTESDFFVEVGRVLLSGTNPADPWNKSEKRKAVASFAEDLAEWTEKHGCPAVLSTKPETWAATRRALGWLGYRVRGEGPGFEAEPLADPEAVRRQAFLDVLGLPVMDVLERLAAGEDVRVECASGTAELPFSLSAWRETLGLDEKRLNARNAFLRFVTDVPASRMMMALHGVDARTREELRAVGGPAGGYAGWKLMYEKALDGFALYPEALEIRNGEIRLPGGAAAEPVWEAVVGEPPSDLARFVVKVFGSASGKAAYVVDALRPLSEETARAFVLGASGGGEEAVERFERLYSAIGKTGRSYGNSQRDPWDFTQLAGYLRSAAGGEIELPGGAGTWLEALESPSMPEGEAELQQLLAAAAERTEGPAEALERILREETSGVSGPLPAVKRFIVVSSLVRDRPDLGDPATLLLLARGVDRFLACYAPLEDLPLGSAETARRYLFTLNRLDSNGTDRDAELRAGLFLASVELLSALFRSGSVSDDVARGLFASLLGQPLFATPRTAPAAGVGSFDLWLHGELLGALRESETRFLGGERAGSLSWEDEEDRGPAKSADDLLFAALSGFRPPATLAFRGGSYVYDAMEDAVARRRAFARTQDHVPLWVLARAAAERESASASARAGDAEATRAAVSALLESLGAIPPAREADERVAATASGARHVLGTLQAATRENVLALLEAGLPRLDALRAERTLEALAVHVYAGHVLDSSDLLFADSLLVKRHSLSWGPRKGIVLPSPFQPARIDTPGEGAPLRLAGGWAGIGAPLGLLHAEGLVYDAGGFLSNDAVRSGLVLPSVLFTPARLDDEGLRFVALACRSAEQLPVALAGLPETERHDAWSRLARDLLPASRRNRLAREGAAVAADDLSPSDLLRIGRRLALRADGALPDVPAAREAREVWARRVERLGEARAGALLAELGPRAFHWEGRSRLGDVTLPSYERLSEYRVPQVFGDRLHDLPIAVARSVSDAGDPAALVPLVLRSALEDLMRRARMAYAFDWRPLAATSGSFWPAQRDAVVGAALSEGRVRRMEVPGP